MKNRKKEHNTVQISLRCPCVFQPRILVLLFSPRGHERSLKSDLQHVLTVTTSNTK
jgi:hypothetical protein